MNVDKITVEDIMAIPPCEGYDTERVTELWAGKKSLSLMEILDLDIPIEDRLWVALRKELFTQRELTLMAADFAESVLHLFEEKFPNDDRPRKAIEAARSGDAEAAAAEAAGEVRAAWAARAALAARATRTAAGAALAAWAAEAAGAARAACAAWTTRAAWTARETLANGAARAALAAERQKQINIVKKHLSKKLEADNAGQLERIEE